MFQLIYLDFTAPRLDHVGVSGVQEPGRRRISRIAASIPTRCSATRCRGRCRQHNFRARPLTAATFAEVNPEKALAFYKDRFADASDFTFVVRRQRRHADAQAARREVPRVAAVDRAKGDVPRQRRRRRRRASSRRSCARASSRRRTRSSTSPARVSTRRRRGSTMRALIELFQIKLNESLREQLGGAYSPSVGGGCGRFRGRSTRSQVQFNSSPENVEKLTKSVFALIDSLKTQGPTAGRRRQGEGAADPRRARSRSSRTATGWATSWRATRRARTSPACSAPYDAMIKNLTPAQIQEAAKKYFDTTNYARFVLLPENGKTTP